MDERVVTGLRRELLVALYAAQDHLCRAHQELADLIGYQPYDTPVLLAERRIETRAMVYDECLERFEDLNRAVKVK